MFTCFLFRLFSYIFCALLCKVMDGLEKISLFQVDFASVKYLKDVTQILAEYAWMYNVRNIDIFLYNVLENIPSSWCEALSELSNEDFCRLPFNLIKDEWPSSLSLFVSKCHRLGNFRFSMSTLQDIQKTAEKLNYVPEKVTSKKQFEIGIIASLIGKVCQDLDCHLVLDVGSGLGYLDQVLHHSFNLKCIGLDSSVKHTVAANDRIKNDSCKNSMYHRTLKVTHSEECLEDIKSIIKEKHNWSGSCSCDKRATGSVAMVGLHSCGNLAQDMMKLFCQMDELVALVCVGCCYNKINLLDFPMSKTAQNAVRETCVKFPKWSPCASGLRVAAHGTRLHSVNALVDSHTSKFMFYRALLEYYIKKENISWQQPKRHIRKTDLLDFETYCKNMLSGHHLGNDESTLKNLNNLYNEKLHLFSSVRILLVLQLLLQPLWEGFITVDRILYFREKSMSANVLVLWDDAKSSRNLALCVNKR